MASPVRRVSARKMLIMSDMILPTHRGNRSRVSKRGLSTRTGLPSFAIAFDIDGVLLRDGKAIGGAPTALRRLYEDPAHPAQLRIPYVFLTNGGGSTEASRATELSKQLEIPASSDQVLLGHSPFRKLVDRFKQKRVLAIGKGVPDVVMRNYGFDKVVHMDSYVHEFANIDGLSRFKSWIQLSEKDSGKPLSDHQSQIEGVFVVSDPVDWSRDIQVMCDVLRSNGKPGEEGTLSQPPLFFAADDLDYQSTFPVPRLGMGAFRIALESIYNLIPGTPLQYVSYGKPQRIVYEDASHVLQSLSKRIFLKANIVSEPAMPSPPPSNDPVLKKQVSEYLPFRTIYMIGDNPSTDIIGAKSAGQPWFAILTRTGCYRGQPISGLYQPDKVVEDVEEAIHFILQREGLT